MQPENRNKVFPALWARRENRSSQQDLDSSQRGSNASKVPNGAVVDYAKNKDGIKADRCL